MLDKPCWRSSRAITGTISTFAFNPKKNRSATSTICGGERGGLIVVDMTASSQVVEVAERFFFGLNAKVEMVPVMALEDLEQGLSSIEGILQRYG